MNQQNGRAGAGVEELREAVANLRARLGERPHDVDQQRDGTGVSDTDAALTSALKERDAALDQMRALETAHSMDLHRIEELERTLHAKEVALVQEVRRGDSMRERLGEAEQKCVTGAAQLESKQRRLNHLAVALAAAKKERDQAERELRGRRGEDALLEAVAKESAALAEAIAERDRVLAEYRDQTEQLLALEQTLVETGAALTKVLKERDRIVAERDALTEQLREGRRRSLDRAPSSGLATNQRLRTEGISADAEAEVSDAAQECAVAAESLGVDVATLRPTREIVMNGIHVRTSMGSNRMEELNAWLAGS